MDLDADDKISILEFDSNAKGLSDSTSSDIRVKFIVAQIQPLTVDDKSHTKMYVFNSRNSYADFYRKLQETVGLHTLLSGGFIDLKSDSGFGFVMSRNLTGNSDTLETIFGLTKEASDSYRKGLLVQKLGSKHFTAYK